MRLWTLQPHEVHAELQAGLTFRAQRALCERDGFVGEPLENMDIHKAYAWMARALVHRDTPPEGVELPVWAWHTYNPARPGKLDLREYRYPVAGVCLELDVALERVLLSDFDLWHHALNGWHVGTQTEDEAFEVACEARGLKWGEWWLHEDLGERVVASWESILNLDWHAPGWGGGPREEKVIQAVLWEVRPEDVVGVRAVRPQRQRST